MRKAFLFFILIGIISAVGFGQTSVTAKKTVEPKSKRTPATQKKTVEPKAKQAPPIPKKTIEPKAKQAAAIPKKSLAAAQITDAEWTTLTKSLAAEDWTASAELADRLLSRAKTDDEEKRVAQLRYIYLYALAGKIFQLAAQPNSTAESAAREQLVRATARFTGREFVLPARQFLSDCKNVVNYICTVKNGGGTAFRSTATGKSGTEIHSFDYVSFDRTIDLKAFAENKTFLGGFLRKVEFNDDLKKPWIMRLIFERGFVRVIVG